MIGRLLQQLMARARGGANAPPEPDWLSAARASIASGQVGTAIGLLTPHAAGPDAAFEVLHLLGQALGMSGRLAEARAALARGVAMRDGAAIRADLGNVLQLSGDAAAAAAEYRRSLALDRAQPAVWCNLGLALAAHGDAAEAATCLDEALSRAATHAAALGAYATLAPRHAGLWERFERHVQRALAAQPDSAVALEAQGFIFLKRDLDGARAAEVFERAIRAGGDRADLYGNYGIALQDLGRIEEAIAAYDRAIAREPGHTSARWHRSLALLLVGRFAEAWPDYELRLRSEDVPQRTFPVPRWDLQSRPAGVLLLCTVHQTIRNSYMLAPATAPDAAPCARVLQDPRHAAPLKDWGPVSVPLAGASHTSGVLLHKGPGGHTESGVWVCTPGTWYCHVTSDELCHFLAGRCTYTHESGEVIEVGPDTLALFPQDWKGRCVVPETVRKVYMIR